MASRSIASTWESITFTNSLMLWVSSSSIALGQFCVAVGKPRKGIWLRFLRGESSGTPKACNATNQPSSKASFQASLMTGSAEFSVSVNPSLYHLFSLASKAAFRLANSLACAVFQLTAFASFSLVSPSLVFSYEDLFFANALASSDVIAFFSVAAAVLVFSFAFASATSFKAFSRSASLASSFTRPSRMWVNWVT